MIYCAYFWRKYLAALTICLCFVSILYVTFRIIIISYRSESRLGLGPSTSLESTVKEGYISIKDKT